MNNSKGALRAGWLLLINGDAIEVVSEQKFHIDARTAEKNRRMVQMMSGDVMRRNNKACRKIQAIPTRKRRK